MRIIKHFLFLTIVFWTQANVVFAERILIGVPGLGVSYFPLVAAMYKGFMKEEGLEPGVVVMRLGVVPGALMSGDLDYSTGGFSTVPGAVAKGAPLKVFVVVTGRPQHALVVKKPEIKTIKDLVGKPISVNPGAVERMAIEIFRKHRLDPTRDLKLVYTGEPAARLAMLDRGLVDGAILDLVGTAKAEEVGFRIVQNIAEISQIPLAALAASERKIRSNPDQVKRLIRATLRGVQYYMDVQNKEEIIPMISKWSKIEPKIASRVYDLGVISHNRDGMPTEEMLQEVAKGLADVGVSQSYEFVKTNLLDFTLLREVLAAGLKK
jgi:NitT/TauT family transport system substrate-binding protein